MFITKFDRFERLSNKWQSGKRRRIDSVTKQPTFALRRSSGQFVIWSSLLPDLTDGFNQSNESRLQTDFRTVQSERARLQQLIENLNNVGTENERTRNEDRMRLEQRIEELQRDG